MVDPIIELCKTLDPYSLEWWLAGCWYYTAAVDIRVTALIFLGVGAAAWARERWIGRRLA